MAPAAAPSRAVRAPASTRPASGAHRRARAAPGATPATTTRPGSALIELGQHPTGAVEDAPRPRRCGACATGRRSVTRTSTVAGQLRCTVASATHGRASIRRATAPVSTSIIAEPGRMPAAAAHLGGRGAHGARDLRPRRRRGAGDRDRRRRPAATEGERPATTIARRTRRRRPSSRRTSMRRARDARVGPARSRGRTRPGRSRGRGRRRCAARTRARTSPMSAHTSSAEPPSSAWMKLACLVDTSARAEPQALAAGRVDQPAGRVARRVGEHRAGVLAAGLVRPAPPDDLGDLGLAGGAVARRERELGPHDDARRRRSPSRGSRGRGPAPGTIPSSPAGEVDDADPRQAGGHVRAVAAGVHPHRAADRAGHARPPTRTR